MNVDDGTIKRLREINDLCEAERERYVPIKRELTGTELQANKIELDAPCGCGSGNAFGACCWNLKQDTQPLILDIGDLVRGEVQLPRAGRSEIRRAKLLGIIAGVYDEKVLVCGTQTLSDDVWPFVGLIDIADTVLLRRAEEDDFALNAEASNDHLTPSPAPDPTP